MTTGDNANTGVTNTRLCNMVLPNNTVLVARRNADKIVQWFDIDNGNIIDVGHLLGEISITSDFVLV
jgi:hypothetical protein